MPLWTVTTGTGIHWEYEPYLVTSPQLNNKLILIVYLLLLSVSAYL